MNIKYLEEKSILMIEVTEEIDHHIVEIIRRKVDYEIARLLPKKVVFDFDNVSFMDSAGIGMLIGRYKTAKMFNGDLEIINVKSNIKKILEMSGILKIININEELKKIS